MPPGRPAYIRLAIPGSATRSSPGPAMEGALKAQIGRKDLTMCDVAARIFDGSFYALSLAEGYVVVRRSE